MNLHWIDWLIIGVFFFGLTAVATYTRRYTKSVADFLSANRCAGRYLLTVSGDMANLGAISLVGMYQLYYQAGFTVSWWQGMAIPVGIVVALTGFVIYRFRQTRSLTIAEFFERRYSRKFRIFMGFVIFISGILNFGIFPAVGAKFFIHFCGFPPSFNILGISLSSYPTVMAVLLIASLYFTYMGGQIAVTITDFIQAFFCSIALTSITLFIFFKVGWASMEEVLIKPENVHMIHPFRGDNIPDFNVWYFMMGIALGLYATRTWQGTQGYNSSALTPHEAKMGGILAALRGMVGGASSFIIPVAAYVILRHNNFTPLASEINTTLDTIANEEIRNQMIVPVMMSKMLSVGLMGCFAAVFLAAFISTHDTYMHSWGSIFIQDVVMPFRKKPFSEKTHIHLLRLSILGVAVFIFCFSMLWRQTQAILLWFQITGAIYGAGAGAVMLGGLYWKKGTTAAAYCAMIAGSTLALTGIYIIQKNPEFFLNSMQMSFIAALISFLLYVTVSLFGAKRKDYNLDKLLHRGPYAVEGDVVKGASEKESAWVKLGLSKEFSMGDKVIFFSLLGISSFWFLIFVTGTIYHFAFGTSEQFWLTYWKYYIPVSLILAVIMVVWMSIGGLLDVRKMFRLLKTIKRDAHDDGWVESEENLQNEQ